MSSTGATTNVVLRSWPSQPKEKLEPDDIFVQISQLATERGHLRETTEESLQEELDAGRDGADDVMQGIEKSEEEQGPTRQERLDELRKAQFEMGNKLSTILFTANSALDLVALILTKDPARYNPTSFSNEFAKKRIPLGSWGITRVTKPGQPPPQEEQALIEKGHREALAAKGAKMNGLEWATDTLLKAATQLGTEDRKESKYWDDVLSISEKGWAVQRQRKSRSLAVRYGFPEASDHFKARGFAPLRMGKDGGIILDPSLTLQPKTLRVRISDNGKITGTSSLATRGDGAELDIEKSIQLARDSLFEEEIYHEMSLETRQFLAYGIEMRESVIHLAVPGLDQGSTHRKILFDCVARDDSIVVSEKQPQDWLAQNIAEAVRLLLAHEHRNRLFRRSQIPSPLTQRKRSQQSPALLRTLLAMFTHISAVDAMRFHLNQTVKTLGKAGLHVSLKATRETSWEKLSDTIQTSQRTDRSAIDHLFDAFIKPLDGMCTLSLPSSNGSQTEEITIATRTFIGPPTFGAAYKVTLPASLAAVLHLPQEQKREFKMSSAEETKSYIDWLISLDLSHTLLYREYGSRALIKSKEPQVTLRFKDGKKVIDKDVSVELADGKLEVAVLQTVGKVAIGAQRFTWNVNGGEGTFKEKIKTSASW